MTMTWNHGESQDAHFGLTVSNIYPILSAIDFRTFRAIERQFCRVGHDDRSTGSTSVVKSAAQNRARNTQLVGVALTSIDFSRRVKS